MNLKGLQTSHLPPLLVFPEGEDPRIVRAAGSLSADALVRPVLLGDRGKVERIAQREGVTSEQLSIVDPAAAEAVPRYAAAYAAGPRKLKPALAQMARRGA